MLRHICEVCGLTEDLTSEAAFNAGWDYPPRIAAYGVLSPRTCPNCPLTATLWFRLTTGVTNSDSLSEADAKLIARVLAEPLSIQLTN